MLGETQLQALADDIREHGQEHPIVTHEDAILDGRNRYAACRLAGVPPQFVKYAGSDPIAFIISANLRRRQLSASQRAMIGARLVPEYRAEAKERQRAAGGDQSKKALQVNSPEAGQARDKAAAAVDVGGQAVTFAERVLEAIPELSLAVDRDLVAVSDAAKIARLSEQDQAEVLASILAGEAKTSKQAVKQLRTRALALLPAAASDEALVLTGDAVACLSQVRTAHCVVMDPPYGIDAHHANYDYRSTDYADGTDYALQLLRETCAALVKVCAPDAHLYVFSGYTHAWTFKQILAEFFDVQDNPLIWVKNSHSPCDFSQRYPSSHEYIWFARMRGSKRPLARLVKDIIPCPHDRATDHSAEKPTDLLQLLIEQSTLAGEHVVDPFCGSGSTGVASRMCGRQFTGIELQEKWADVARGRLHLAATEAAE